MKVLNYLQNNVNGFNPDFVNMIVKLGFTSDYLFYSQPFKPEMITELFEGWGFQHIHTIGGIKISGKRYRNLGYEIEVTFYDAQYYDIAQGVDDITDFIYPRTLDDFINDCARAGIELEWKK